MTRILPAVPFLLVKLLQLMLLSHSYKRCVHCADNYEPVFPRNSDPLVQYPVPNIVHQTYDYQSPSFFLYLSLKCVQRFLQPEKHVLWVNDEGRFRRGQWDSWQQQAAAQSQQKDSWMYDMKLMIDAKKIEVRFLTFPAHPPGNSTAFAHEKAHRSDLLRMDVLLRMGGIYLDTDVFVVSEALHQLRVHNFTLSFDNIVNPDAAAPKRVNNGVLLAAPNAHFLQLWQREYTRHFNPHSFDYDSSVVPWRLATQFPDLLHVEMWRIAPLSFAFQTANIADALTCGILVPPGSSYSIVTGSSTGITTGSSRGAIWAPVWGNDGKGFTFRGTIPDEYMYAALSQKLALHLTMTQVRGISMMRKALGDAKDLDRLPSLLGRLFRIALHGSDSFDYSRIVSASAEQKDVAFRACRDHLGMHRTPDTDDTSRQQYTLQHLLKP